jgi:hypothetical protein
MEILTIMINLAETGATVWKHTKNEQTKSLLYTLDISFVSYQRPDIQLSSAVSDILVSYSGGPYFESRPTGGHPDRF